MNVWEPAFQMVKVVAKGQFSVAKQFNWRWQLIGVFHNDSDILFCFANKCYFDSMVLFLSKILFGQHV
jgi:hypothetical protein